MTLPLRALAALLAAVALSGCTSTAGGADPGAAVNAFLDVARLVAEAQSYAGTGTGSDPAPILKGRSMLGQLETSISKLADTPAKHDLKNAAAALRSALNGSAYLLDSFQAVKANRTGDALVNLDAARANFTEAQQLASKVSDPELRQAMDYSGVVAEIDRMAAGLKER